MNGQDMPMEVTAWLTNVGRYEDAVRYGALFWPTFAEMDGCVFLGSGVPDTFGSGEPSSELIGSGSRRS